MPLLQQLGFTVSPDVEALGSSVTEGFFAPVSLEKVPTLVSDFHVAWANTDEDVARTVENPLVARWAPIAAGHYYFFQDQNLGWATTAPSVLSIPATIEDLAQALSPKVPSKG